MYARTGGGGRGQNGSNSATARAGMAAITPMVKNYQTVGSSGSDGGGGGANWNSLNPNLYQNMSNDQVDWAALAQQWIQMKETLPPEMVPAAPPPPVISWNRSPEPTTTTISEQGEAPMEVERDEDPHSSGGQQQQQTTGTWQNGSIAWQYPAATTTEWRNPAWETSWSTGSGGNQASSSSTAVPVVNPQASMAVANWQAKMSRIYKINEGGAGPEPIAGTVQATNSKPQQQPFVGDASKRIPGLMDQVINLDHNSDEGQGGDQDEDTTQTINDAKRKLLPAWIREGLEKMEREKQRQVEREKEQKQREQMLEQRRQAELEALSELENAKKKSKFESDSEEEEPGADEQESPSREPSPEPVRSREEILQELMIAVRKNLTEILLEVTNEEIAVLAKETLAKTRRKAPTAQALRKTGLATLTGGLGLGMYGDSDDDDDEDEDDEDGSGSQKGRTASDGESEEDDEEVEKMLRHTIKQRQKEFEWTAREIEDQLAQEEAREERKRREYEQQQRQDNNNSDDEDGYGGGQAGFGHASSASSSVGGSGSVSGGKSGSRDGETQPVNDKIYAHKLGRTRDKRISRFSDPKDTVRQTHITHVAIVNHKIGEIIVPALQIPKAGQMAPTATMISSGISPPVAQNVASAPLFPAAGISGSMDSYRRENSVASETPSNASSSRASSSHRTGHKEKSSSSSSRHRTHKSKKHKRSRYSRSDDDENDCYVVDERDEDRYSHYSSSRRSRSSERSSHSRRRRSYSRESRDGPRGGRRSRSPRDYRYRSSRRSRSRTRSPLSRRGRY